MTAIRLEQVTKRYDATVALDVVDLSIHEGELFFLLGPSGCGKSTLLRLIAGLQSPTQGRILFDGRDVTSEPTQQRNAVMCFQGYALWPHMTVREHIRFGLSVRNMPVPQQEARIEEMLALIQMQGELASRKPGQLSGGQQQRVAPARALAVQPKCLLLDEPLSNLDTIFRHAMRREIQRICKQTGITTLYVTHGQKEALSSADRIAVLQDGKLMQVGTPVELYQSPATAFVADFNIGASSTTTLRRITAPLISANLIAGALLVFAFTMLEVSDSLILVQKQAYWPAIRGIYELFQRLGDGPYIASALGAWTMLLMVVILFVNSLLGKRLGALFRI